MRVRIGCRFVHDASSATPAVVLAEPHSEIHEQVVDEHWTMHQRRVLIITFQIQVIAVIGVQAFVVAHYPVTQTHETESSPDWGPVP